MFRKVFLTYLATLALAMGIFAVLAARFLRGLILEEIEVRMDSEIEVLRSVVRAGLPPDSLAGALRELGSRGEMRFTVIDGEGRVMADSHADPAGMADHNERPEVREARRVGRGRRIHYSETLRLEMMYFARPLEEGRPEGAVLRCALPLREVDRQLRTLYAGLAWIFLAMAVAGTGGAWLLARWISAPLRAIQEAAQAIAGGDFRHRAPLTSGDEIGSVAASLNRMAEELSTRIERLKEERSKLETVLAGMREGVVAVDRQGEILHMNRAARDLLGLGGEVAGLKVWEAIRLPSFVEAVRGVLAGAPSVRVAAEAAPRALEAVANSVGEGRGAVVVIRDVTEDRKYDELRKEFVANVSHELRTPLSLIRGYVETLREGALGDSERAAGFLETIEKNVRRLGAIVDDLLELSRLESGLSPLRFRRIEARALLEKVREDFRPLAESKRQTLSVVSGPGLLFVRADPDFLERALRNLVDNAVKYVQEGGSITLEAAEEGGQIVFKVVDNGPGIPPQDLPRIFERFYRVDKSRSRELGGTGLGLSIVKHIAQLHGGEAIVQSEPGSGCVFSIRLPRR